MDSNLLGVVGLTSANVSAALSPQTHPGAVLLVRCCRDTGDRT